MQQKPLNPDFKNLDQAIKNFKMAGSMPQSDADTNRLISSNLEACNKAKSHYDNKKEIQVPNVQDDLGKLSNVAKIDWKLQPGISFTTSVTVQRCSIM